MARSNHRPRVALVHDWLNQMGGAERVLLEMARLWPDSPIYTSIFDPDALDEEFASLDVRTSLMQVLPAVFSHHRRYLPAYAATFARWWISDADVIISNASGFCRWIPTNGNTTHVCYCLTPPRYLWDSQRYLAAERDYPRALDGAVRLGLEGLRRLDKMMADRTDYFIAISRCVAERIRRYYGRRSDIIYPPVRTEQFAPAPAAEIGDHLLLVSRLAPYKRIDVAIRACNALKLRLKILGTGRAEPDLRSISGPTIEFAGRVSEQRLAHELARCRAVIFPGEEDFGLVPVEAQAAGRPVIAFAGGGALETVLADRTGVFFDQPTAPSLIATLEQFDAGSFDPGTLVDHAQKFSVARFASELSAYINNLGTWSHDLGRAPTKQPKVNRVR